MHIVEWVEHNETYPAQYFIQQNHSCNLQVHTYVTKPAPKRLAEITTGLSAPLQHH